MWVALACWYGGNAYLHDILFSFLLLHLIPACFYRQELPAEILFTFFCTGWFSDCQRFNTTIIIMLLPISFPYSVYTTYHHDDSIRKEKYLHPLTYNMDIYLRQPRYLSSASKKFNAFKKYRIWIIPIWYSRQFMFCSTLLYNVSFYIRI